MGYVVKSSISYEKNKYLGRRGYAVSRKSAKVYKTKAGAEKAASNWDCAKVVRVKAS